MAASGRANAVRRSPLMAVLALLATATAAFVLLLLPRVRTREPARAAATAVAGDRTPPAPARAARARVPRFVAEPDHTAAQREELAAVDRLARARAAAAVGLTSAEAQKTEILYREADRRRDQIEVEIDAPSTGQPSRQAPSRLWRHEARLLADMRGALGEARGQALRAAEAVAYQELVQQAASGSGRTFPISQRHTRRRSSAMFYLQSIIEAAQEGEPTGEGGPTEGGGR